MDNTFSKRVTYPDAKGLHLRPADLLARKAREFDAEVELVKNGQRVDATSILEIMTLAIEHGADFTISARGPKAQEAVEALADLVENRLADPAPQSNP